MKLEFASFWVIKEYIIIRLLLYSLKNYISTYMYTCIEREHARVSRVLECLVL